MKSDVCINVERDIIKSYRTKLWAKFIHALQEYHLISEGDKVAVAVSGGKDSLILAKLMQQVALYGDMKFDLEFITMNPGFSSENLELLKKNCELLDIPVKIFDSNVFEVAESLDNEKPCYMCARMRRGFLYKKAKELGCNKLALGHHFDDVIETTMLNIFYAGCFKTMVPKVKSENYEDIELIRPLYFVYEKDIRNILNKNGITTMNCGCKVTRCEVDSKRREVKELIKELSKNNPILMKNIFASAENVNIDAILGYKEGNNKYDFNDIYHKLNGGDEDDK